MFKLRYNNIQMKKSMQKDTVYIVVPAYNEGPRVAETIEKVPKSIAIDGNVYHLQVVVANDGSRDNTSLAAQGVKGAIVIDRIINMGAGAATRTGILYAINQDNCAGIATMDADGQHAIEDVLNVITQSLGNGYDFVIGTRLLNANGMPHHKRIGNFGLSALTWLILGVKSTDSQSGLRYFSPLAAEKIAWHSDGFGFCSEMLISARKKHHEIGIQAIYDEYSKAKGQSSWNALNIFKTLFSARLRSLLYE
jgi:polyprenyl-phospho-N-acetylgalactosaminyl synthase